ncbi:RNA polymerase sigma-70 factor [Gaoshiqia sp. Z1-71]|uniref:RNA polymerase sigma-70 factor n=1 Tax=Gaoshiqia hydrogeniformans TaxID=3290090 RepID=UPI003BF82970
MDGNKLAKQLKLGGKQAINDLYGAYSSRLYRFAFGYLKSEEDARDVIQEVFIRLWNKRNELKDDTNMEAFLFTLAKNTVISLFRKKISEKDYLEQLRYLVVKNSSDTENQVNYKLLSEKVTQLISRLPEQRRRIFLLSKEKGYPNKSIAEELHISVKTVEDHLSKARKFLKNNLDEYGFLAILFYEMFI